MKGHGPLLSQADRRRLASSVPCAVRCFELTRDRPGASSPKCVAGTPVAGPSHCAWQNERPARSIRLERWCLAEDATQRGSIRTQHRVSSARDACLVPGNQACTVVATSLDEATSTCTQDDATGARRRQEAGTSPVGRVWSAQELDPVEGWSRFFPGSAGQRWNRPGKGLRTKRPLSLGRGGNYQPKAGTLFSH
jgi:hypothetical protein